MKKLIAILAVMLCLAGAAGAEYKIVLIDQNGVYDCELYDPGRDEIYQADHIALYEEVIRLSSENAALKEENERVATGHKYVLLCTIVEQQVCPCPEKIPGCCVMHYGNPIRREEVYVFNNKEDLLRSWNIKQGELYNFSPWLTKSFVAYELGKEVMLEELKLYLTH
jgi:hypothetical protein